MSFEYCLALALTICFSNSLLDAIVIYWLKTFYRRASVNNDLSPSLDSYTYVNRAVNSICHLFLKARMETLEKIKSVVSGDTLKTEAGIEFAMKCAQDKMLQITFDTIIDGLVNHVRPELNGDENVEIDLLASAAQIEQPRSLTPIYGLIRSSWPYSTVTLRVTGLRITTVFLRTVYDQILSSTSTRKWFFLLIVDVPYTLLHAHIV